MSGSERWSSPPRTTVWRCVQRYAPDINKRIRPHLKLAGASYRIDETYVKVGREWKFLYRALDKDGNTIDFMLSDLQPFQSVWRGMPGRASCVLRHERRCQLGLARYPLHLC